ncbi:MAG: hypothetical protein SGILL_007340 [Bacillariaceae sp.]
MSEGNQEWLSYEQEYYDSLTTPSPSPAAVLASSNSTTQDAEYFSDFAFFTNGQYAVLFVVGLISCVLSLLGSCLILYLVIEGKRTNELYHRLLLGLSISDMIMTISLLMQPILVPRETGYLFALGNASSCAFLGFGYLFFIASYAYNCMLGIYFLATVRFWKLPKPDTKHCFLWRCLYRYMEPMGHFVAFAMPIAIGSAAIHFDLLNANPFLGVCSMFPSNHECEWKDDVEGECQNDNQYNVLNSVLDYYALSCVAIGLLCTIGVYLTVKIRYGSKNKRKCCGCLTKPNVKTRSKCKIKISEEIIDSDDDSQDELTVPAGSAFASSPMARISEDVDEDGLSSTDGTSQEKKAPKGRLNNVDETAESDSPIDAASNDSFTRNPSLEPNNDADRVARRQNAAQEMRVKQISTQAVCYAAAYLAGMLCVVVANVVDDIYLDESSESLQVLGEEPLYFFVIFMVWLLFPLQGFFNAIIYIRPRLVRWKHHYEDSSWWFAFRMVLTTETPPGWGQPTESACSRVRQSRQSKKQRGSRDKNGRQKENQEAAPYAKS